MAYEFKKLSDVEVVAEPAESANVLIEEDGVIKKAPKTAVGGVVDGAGGSDEPDMIITLNSDNNQYASGWTIDSFSIAYGDITDVNEKLDNKKPVKIFLVGDMTAGSGYVFTLVCPASQVTKSRSDSYNTVVTFIVNPQDGGYSNSETWKIGFLINRSNLIENFYKHIFLMDN